MAEIVNLGIGLGRGFTPLTNCSYHHRPLSQLTKLDSIDNKWTLLHHKLNTNAKFICLFSDNKKQRYRLASRAKAQQLQEIRVCTNRTCRRQGSFQTLETLSGLAPPNVAVKSCGCLGRCGAGPNLVVMPDGLIVGHCGTAAQSAEVLLTLFAGGDNSGSYGLDPKNSLDALALRKRADMELAKRNFTEAELLLSQAIDLKPFGGIHVTFKCRSFVRLEFGNYTGALEDAKEALALAPKYSEAYIAQGDAFLALNQLDSAEQSYLASLDIDPSIRHSKSFKAQITKLQEKLAAANTS